jgi:hypothetical protein
MLASTATVSLFVCLRTPQRLETVAFPRTHHGTAVHPAATARPGRLPACAYILHRPEL